MHTGLNHPGSRITEVAAYCPATGQGMSTLVHIGDKQVPESITQCTGITNDMVHQPHLPKIWYATLLKRCTRLGGWIAMLLHCCGLVLFMRLCSNGLISSYHY